MNTLKQSSPAIVALSLICVEALGAGPPPLERPSPPACCADGLCYPNRMTWGVYGTRWRRWPTEQLQPTPDEMRAPAAPSTEVPPFERPPAEDEEQAAPPPTRAAEEAREEEEEDAGPRTPQPAVLPFGTPPDSATQPAPPSPLENNRPAPPGMTFPWEQETPTTPETTPLEDTPPTGDWDPPPTPPFGSRGDSSLVERGAAPSAERPALRPVPRGTAPSNRAPSDDPPPAFPIAMASAR
jgi:hypothetical protein